MPGFSGGLLLASDVGNKAEVDFIIFSRFGGTNVLVATCVFAELRMFKGVSGPSGIPERLPCVLPRLSLSSPPSLPVRTGSEPKIGDFLAKSGRPEFSGCSRCFG